MKRPRPYIPLDIRCEVALSQLGDDWPLLTIDEHRTMAGGLSKLLEDSLCKLAELSDSDGAGMHLDHDPPLRVRDFNPVTGKYTPDANNPSFLVYRTAVAHRLKTNVRGDGAQYPDRVLIGRKRKQERKKKKRKYKWLKRKLRS